MIRQTLVGLFTGMLIASSPTSVCVFVLMWYEESFGAALEAFHDLVERAWPEAKK